MALTFLAMQTEFYARGFTYLSPTQDTTLAGQTRAKRWLNDAAHRIDEAADWPYLQNTQTGVSPLTIADLRTVECVTDVGNLNTLLPADLRDLRDQYGDLTMAGTATYYYITGGTTITAFPVTTATLTVDYWKFAPDMVADADVPLMPDRFRMAVVHYAVAMAHRDAANDAAAAAAQQDGDVLVGQMMSLLTPQHQGSSVFVAAVGDDL